MSTAILYDLAGKNRDVRFSPFCWLAKYALKHKHVAFDTIALGFQPKADYPDPDYGKLPMLKINDDLIKGSNEIIAWLDENIDDYPLVGGEAGQARLKEVQDWLGNSLFPALGPLLFNRVSTAISEQDREYFITTREKRFGTTLEALAQTPGQAEKAHQASRELSVKLGDDPFLSGKAPGLADYTALAPYLWQRSISSEALYDMDAGAAAWLERMLDLFDGYGRALSCADC